MVAVRSLLPLYRFIRRDHYNDFIRDNRTRQQMSKRACYLYGVGRGYIDIIICKACCVCDRVGGSAIGTLALNPLNVLCRYLCVPLVI